MWLALLIIIATVALLHAPLWLGEIATDDGDWQRSYVYYFVGEQLPTAAPLLDHTDAPARGPPPSTNHTERGVEGVE